jgi:hypothetical protein
MNPNLKLVKSDCWIDQQSLQERNHFEKKKLPEYGLIEDSLTVYFYNNDNRFLLNYRNKEYEIISESENPKFLITAEDLFKIEKNTLFKFSKMNSEFSVVTECGDLFGIAVDKNSIYHIKGDELLKSSVIGNPEKKEKIKFEILFQKKLASIDVRKETIAIGTEDGLIIVVQKKNNEYIINSVFSVEGSSDFIRLGEDFLFSGCFRLNKGWQWLSKPGKTQYGLVPDREFELPSKKDLQVIFATKHIIYFISNNQIHEFDLVAFDAKKINDKLQVNLLDVDAFKERVKKKLSIQDFKDIIRYLQNHLQACLRSLEIQSTNQDLNSDVSVYDLESIDKLLDGQLIEIRSLFSILSEKHAIYGNNIIHKCNLERYLGNIEKSQWYSETLLISDKNNRKYLVRKYKNIYGGNWGICVELTNFLPSHYYFCIMINPRRMIQQFPEEFRETLRLLSNIFSFDQILSIMIRSILSECREFIIKPDTNLDAFISDTIQMLRDASQDTVEE